MILKLCDSNPTTGKQRALEINQNQWKKRDNEKWKMWSSVYADLEKSDIWIKVPVNRMTEKSPKSPFLILHRWEAFMNLIAGSLRDLTEFDLSSHQSFGQLGLLRELQAFEVLSL